jgi:hypothetical protein
LLLTPTFIENEALPFIETAKARKSRGSWVNSLVERVNQTQLQEKDPDAEALLNRALGPNPDALYILAQTVLVQNIALEQAKAQMAQFQQQAQQTRQPAHATSFLGSLLGHRDPDPPPTQPAYQPVNPQYVQPAPQPQRNRNQQYIASGPPSFLRGAMQTAAGVAAGALAFEGVESVLHGLGDHSGYGWGGGGLGMGPVIGGGFDRPVEETVINNYYDDPNAQGGEHRGFEQGGERHFHESGRPIRSTTHRCQLQHAGRRPQRDRRQQCGHFVKLAMRRT